MGEIQRRKGRDTMTNFESNAAVTSGYYFNPMTMSIALVSRDGDRLPSGQGAWLAVPALLALALTPVLGALFLMFLPMIGFVMCAEAAGKNLVAAFSGSAGELAATMAPGWMPGEAHLAGNPVVARRAHEEIDPLDLRLAALEREIERRRRG
jgi:hypothetical protein